MNAHPNDAEGGSEHASIPELSTLFTSHGVDQHFADEAGLLKAVEWCRNYGITKVYIESYRGPHWSDRGALERGRDRFLDEGFAVSGCVTTTRLEKSSVVPGVQASETESYFACYTDKRSLETLQRVFEHTAELFDEIMIDDFFCTCCACPDCRAARGNRAWADFRTDLMIRVSRERVMTPVRRVNPRCRVILKFPNWYDHYRSRGYDVVRQSECFDAVYTGTETRDPDPPDRFGINRQSGGCFIMRWVTDVAGEYNRGGWFDYIQTSQDTFREQARQTVLGGAREVMLFNYSRLIEGVGAANMTALQEELPGLRHLAALMAGRNPRGVTVPKPPESSDIEDRETRLGADHYFYSALGMLGLPLAPVAKLPDRIDAIVGSRHLLYDKAMLSAIVERIAAGTPALLTDGLAREIGADARGALVLGVGRDSQTLLSQSEASLNRMRDYILAPLGLTFHAPARVGLYLFGDDLMIVENFNDRPVEIDLERQGVGGEMRQELVLPLTAVVARQIRNGGITAILPARTLLAVRNRTEHENGE